VLLFRGVSVVIRRFVATVSTAAALLTLATPAGAVITVTNTMKWQAASALQAMRELNLIVLGDVNAASDVEGKIFVGGNVNGSTWDIGHGRASGTGAAYSSRPTLLVGGNINIGGGGLKIVAENVANGNRGYVGDVVKRDAQGKIVYANGKPVVADRNVIKVAGSSLKVQMNPDVASLYTGTSVDWQNSDLNGRKVYYGTTKSGFNNEQNAGASPAKLDAGAAQALRNNIGGEVYQMKQNVAALSTVLGQLTGPAGTVTPDANRPQLNPVDAGGYSVFDIFNGASFFGSVGDKINFTPLKDAQGNVLPVVVNIFNGAKPSSLANYVSSGSSTYTWNFNAGDFATLGQSVIWNFVDATSITIGKDMYGSLLAPKATVTTINGANLNGSVVAAIFNQGGEVHLGTFDDSNAPKLALAIAPMVAAPEPATWATMLVGFGAVGGTMRRRRRAAGHAQAA
jgi:choice-of-anchor A domain-containing protein